jgi:hypothetical protein
MKRLTAIAALASATVLAACVPPQQTYTYSQPVYVAPAPVQVCDTSVRVTNRSSNVVEQLYFSHSAIQTWGADQLGASVLYPGQHVDYRMNNAGNYDFRVIWAGGRESQIRGINVCTASEVIVTNRGISAR